MSIGERIAKCRKIRGMSARCLAQEIGISPSFLSLIEKDKRSCKLELIIKISKVLQVAVNHLQGIPPDWYQADLEGDTKFYNSYLLLSDVDKLLVINIVERFLILKKD